MAEDFGTPSSFNQFDFINLSLETTAMEIDFNEIETAIDENGIITVSGDINTLDNYDAGLSLVIGVLEKVTTGNVGSNGETEFHNVLMKFLPDANGISLPAFDAKGTYSFSETFDMTTTFMEEADDLAIIVIVQDNSDKSIIQTEMLLEVPVGGAVGTDIVENNINIYPNPATDFLQISNITNAQIEIYNIYGQKVLSPYLGDCECYVDVTSLSPGTYIVKVFNEELMITEKIIIQ